MNKSKNIIATQVLEALAYRKDQDFDANYIVAYNIEEFDSEDSGDSYVLKSYVLKKISDNEFRVEQMYTSGPGCDSIRAFVVGDSDVYWHNHAIYDKNHKVLFELPDWIAEELSFFCDFPRLITHIKDNIFIFSDSGSYIFLLSPKKHIAFLNSQYYHLSTDSNVEMYKLDSTMFKNFEVTEDLFQELSELDTIDQMKEFILKELTPNSI
jgi:hypothetical protein